MRKYDELITEAIETLDNNDDLFCRCVEELDSYNGFADGFRCYPMDEIDELFCGVSIGDFLDKLGSDFNHRDNYFVDTIYGLESTDYPEEIYRDNTDSGEVLDNLIREGNNIDLSCYDSEFAELLDEICNYDDECESEAG